MINEQIREIEEASHRVCEETRTLRHLRMDTLYNGSLCLARQLQEQQTRVENTILNLFVVLKFHCT